MDESAEEKVLVINANYELFVVAVVWLSLVNWALIFFTRLTPEQDQVVWIVNVGLSVFLLLDFGVRLWRQRRRRRNFLWRQGAWMLLLGSLPVPFAGVMRLS